jgi:ABC-type anion transport system duplicated permease subunit
LKKGRQVNRLISKICDFFLQCGLYSFLRIVLLIFIYHFRICLSLLQLHINHHMNFVYV